MSEYSFIELTKHSNKLLKASSLTSEAFENAKVLLLKKLSIIPSHFISNEILIEAYQLTKDIDKNDTIFIATAMFVNGILWTGDNVLYKGLQKKNFMGISNTNGIRAILRQ
ncbi:MAG: hypothetical protein KF781_07565 [Chitinophagaceae bacterium]|nr:hypothetical protein [Chitinophagaceae bacterium]MCW5905612.1 hypothetical protein [Chitinophagaceae bacterium]